MNTKLLTVVFVLCGLTVHAQIGYENGYFINNEGEKTYCLIRNVDWKDNPTSFEYRVGESVESKRASIETIKEFGITGATTYRRFVVLIDRSSDHAERLSSNRNPEFTQETLFLRVLVEGKGTLYQYENGNLLRFFYGRDEDPVQQLVLKHYLASSSKAARNEAYKQQLWNELKCEGITSRDAENTKYTRTDLTKFFIKYNACNGSVVVKVEQQERRDLFNFTIRPGVSYNALMIKNNNQSSLNIDFPGALGPRIGAEMEIILPTNKSTWSVMLEPIYQSYTAEQTVAASFPIPASSARVDYKSVELALGVRRYFFMKNDYKVFVNAGFNFDFPINSKIVFSSYADLDITTGVGLNLGVGYSKGKIITELRAGLGRGLLGSYPQYESRYNQLALIACYRF